LLGVTLFGIGFAQVYRFFGRKIQILKSHPNNIFKKMQGYSKVLFAIASNDHILYAAICTWLY